jgi:hypothetical protein
MDVDGQSFLSSFVPLRRSDSVWEACASPVPACVERVPMQSFNHQEFLGPHRPYSPPLSDVEEDDIEHIVIHTSYDPLSPENKKVKAPRNRAENVAWSANERSCAEAGERMKSIPDLRNKVRVLIALSQWRW